MWLSLATPAKAQVAGSVALSSNELFRGESISSNAPTASLALSYDHASGLFAGGGASLAFGSGNIRIASANQYAGYARRVGVVSVEAGIIHRSYARLADEEYRRGFFEVYAGVTAKSVKARLYISPDYRRDGLASYYGEVNARLLAVGRWNVEGHAGLSLIPQPDAHGSHPLRPFADWRLQAGRALGPLFLTVGMASTNYPVYSPSGRVRPFVSLSHAF